MIYIEKSTLEKAKQNMEESQQALSKAIANNEDIRTLATDYLQKSSDYRAFLMAHYNL